MKPRKNDLSIVGRLSETPARTHRANYGVDRLGISRAEDTASQETPADQETLAGGSEQAQSSIQQQPAPQPPVATVAPPPAAAPPPEPTQSQQSQVAPNSAAGASLPPAEVPIPSIIAGPARSGRLRKVFWTGVAGVAMMTLLAAYTIHAVRKATQVPAQASGQQPALVITPVPQPIVKPVIANAGPAKPFRISPAVRSAVAEVCVRLQVARVSGPEVARDMRDLLTSIPPMAVPPSGMETPTPQPVTGVAVVTTPAPVSAPAVRFRECPPGFTLSSVIQFPDGAYASLNGKMVKVGGMVSGARVVAIGNFSVEMELSGERFIVGIGQDNVGSRSGDESASEDEPATKPAKTKAKAKTKPKAHTQPAPTPTHEPSEEETPTPAAEE